MLNFWRDVYFNRQISVETYLYLKNLGFGYTFIDVFCICILSLLQLQLTSVCVCGGGGSWGLWGGGGLETRGCPLWTRGLLQRPNTAVMF